MVSIYCGWNRTFQLIQVKILENSIFSFPFLFWGLQREVAYNTEDIFRQ